VVIATAASEIDRLPGAEADVIVGTEAVLHRVHSADTVAILDADSELLAARFRAGAEFLGMVAAAARLAGPSTAGGRLMIQTSLIDHPAIRALAICDPAIASTADDAVRAALGLPPHGAVAVISGAGASTFAQQLAGSSDVHTASDGDRILVKASTVEHLADALSAAERPAGKRLRVAVDPARGA